MFQNKEYKMIFISDPLTFIKYTIIFSNFYYLKKIIFYTTPLIFDYVFMDQFIILFYSYSIYFQTQNTK